MAHHSAILSQPEQVHGQDCCHEACMALLSQGRKGPGKACTWDYSRSLLPSEFLRHHSLQKQHPLFPSRKHRPLRFAAISCILYEELGDNSATILHTMEMLIILSK